MISRRSLLRGASAFLLGGVSLAAYGMGIEPHVRLGVTRYRVTPSASLLITLRRLLPDRLWDALMRHENGALVRALPGRRHAA